MKHTMLLTAVALGASAVLATAQDGGPQPGPGGNGQQPPRRPMSPIIQALDANGDGVIDADEIAHASENLKKLDKNGDGKLTPDEYRPARGPGGPGGPGGGPGMGGPGGPGGRDGGPNGPQ